MRFEVNRRPGERLSFNPRLRRQQLKALREDPALIKCWRVGRGQKLLALLFTIPILLVIAADLVLTDGAWWWAVGCVAFSIAFWLLFAARPRVFLTKSEIVILNKVDESVHRLDEIVSVEPGWAGLVLRTTYGLSVRAWAIQQPNLNLRGNESRANRAARAIMAEVERERSGRS